MNASRSPKPARRGEILARSRHRRGIPPPPPWLFAVPGGENRRSAWHEGGVLFEQFAGRVGFRDGHEVRNRTTRGLNDAEPSVTVAHATWGHGRKRVARWHAPRAQGPGGALRGRDDSMGTRRGRGELHGTSGRHAGGPPRRHIRAILVCHHEGICWCGEWHGMSWGGYTESAGVPARYSGRGLPDR